MEPVSPSSTVVELMDWLRSRDLEEQRWLNTMKLLRYDSEDVVEIAERLLADGWHDDVESLVLAARLLAGHNDVR
jgi:hypothetical protein